MPIELDKGHDEPIFGPEGRMVDITKRLLAAGEIVRRYGRRSKRVITLARSRTRALAKRVGRKGRPAKRRY